MLRRITFSVDEINSEKAIQPKEDDLEITLVRHPEEDSRKPESQIREDHLRITVINVTASRKEELNAWQTVSFEVDYQRHRLAMEARWGSPQGISQNLPQNSAIEGSPEGCATAEPKKSDHRLVKLILKRVDTLVYECFAKKFAEKSGEKFAEAVATVVKWLLFFVFIAVLLMLNGR